MNYIGGFCAQIGIPVNKSAASEKNDPINVLVTALPLTAWGLSRMLELPDAAGLRCIAVAPTVAHAAQLLPSCKPDLVLVDLDSEESSDALAELTVQGEVKILVLTGSLDPATRDKAILAGARGVVDKREDVSTLLKALYKVHDGEMWMDRSATSRIFLELARQKADKTPGSEASRLDVLTSRERQSVDALMKSPAAPAKVLAKDMSISEHTLRNHLTSIYAKLGVANRTELYAFVQRHSPRHGKT